MKQDCSYQGGVLNVPTAFKAYGAVSLQNNLIDCSKQFIKKIKIIPQTSNTPYKVQSNGFHS